MEYLLECKELSALVIRVDIWLDFIKRGDSSGGKMEMKATVSNFGIFMFNQ